MKKAIIELLNSRRFWLVTITAVIAIIELYLPDPIFQIIKVWLIGVTGIGTLDSIATKIGGRG